LAAIAVALSGLAILAAPPALLEHDGDDAAAGPSQTMLSRLDQLAWQAGVGIEQVALAGHRLQSDADILDAVDLANVHSMLVLDTAAVRARIERLPWIATATIERRLPNEVAITVTERTPFAVWRRGGRDVLIDRSGRELSAISNTSTLELPRVEGQDAAEDATRLLDLVAGFPEVSSRMLHAERVAGRRWRLFLQGNTTIELPAEADAAALSMLVEPRAGGRLLDVDARTIDMTLLRRIVIRPSASLKAG
jgi:cell division protein FtsQ